MKWFLSPLCLLFCFLTTRGFTTGLKDGQPSTHTYVASRPLKAERLVGTVTYVFDGDTIQFREANGKKHKVRLHKIDAPEYDQPFGEEAKNYLLSLVLKQQVSLEVVDVDTYGRDVACLYLNDQEINLTLVKEGYAWHYAYHDQTPAYIAAQKAAQKAKKGLWSAPNPIRPYQWRKRRSNEGQ